METQITIDTSITDEKKTYALRIPFATRLGAWAIDFGIILFAGSIIGSIAGTIFLGPVYKAKIAQQLNSTLAESSGLSSLFASMIGIGIGIAIVNIIIILIEGFTGITPGKLLLKIKVGHQNENKASTGQLLLRSTIKHSYTILSSASFLTSLSIFKSIGLFAGLAVFIGFFFILGDKKQGFHDMLSKTCVFKKTQIK